MPSAAAQDVLQAILERRAAAKRRTLGATAAPMVLPFANSRIAGAFEAAQPVRQVDELSAPITLPFAARNQLGDWQGRMPNVLKTIADPRTSPFSPAAVARLFMDPAGEVSREVEAGKQLVEPVTQFNDPNVDPVKQGADLALAAMGMSSVVPSETNALRSGIKAYHGSPHLPMDEASRAARAQEMGFTTDAYHGTRSPVDFDEFSTSGPPRNEMGEAADSGSGADPSAYMGAHFALEPQVASKFATGQGAKWLGARYVEGGGAGGRVMPVKLRGKFKEFADDDEVQSFIYRQPSNDQAVEDELFRLADGDDAAMEDLGARYDADPGFREEINRSAMDNASQWEDGGVSFAEDLAGTARSAIEAEGFHGFKHKNTVEGGTAIAVFEPKNIRSRAAVFDPAKSESGNILAAGGKGARPIVGALAVAKALGERK